MKKVVKFEAEGGYLFNTAEECEAFELKQVHLKRILEAFGSFRDLNEHDIYEFIVDHTKGFKE